MFKLDVLLEGAFGAIKSLAKFNVAFVGPLDLISQPSHPFPKSDLFLWQFLLRFRHFFLP